MKRAIFSLAFAAMAAPCLAATGGGAILLSPGDLPVKPSASAATDTARTASPHDSAKVKGGPAPRGGPRARSGPTVKTAPPATSAFGGKPSHWTVVADAGPTLGPTAAFGGTESEALEVASDAEPLEATQATAVVDVGSTDGPSLGGGYAILLSPGGPAGAGSDPLTCLTQAVYFEARSEPLEGQEAVAQVVMNRTRMAQYPSQVCDVVFQGSDRPTGCQFSFTCDGALGPPAEADAWRRASVVAQRALSGYVYGPLKDATHFHATYVNPYWSGSLTRLGQIGGHIFYH